MSSQGVFSDECSKFLDMMNDIAIDIKQKYYIIKKMINTAIRSFVVEWGNLNETNEINFFFFAEFFIELKTSFTMLIKNKH